MSQASLQTGIRRFSAFLMGAIFVLAIGATPEGQGAGQGGRGGGGGAVPGAGGRGGGRGAQQPPRDTNAQPVGTASISGTVIVDGLGNPVRRARITITGTELRGGRSTITDEQGNFTLTSMPAGRYTMTASKAGFVDISYGAKRPGRQGTPIQLAEGQKLDKLVLRLPRGGVITGIVVDEHGEASPGTQVRALRYVLRTGERTLQQVGTDTTDDRGVYRIYQLQPGDYVVSAVPRNMNIGDLRTALTAEFQSLAQQVQSATGSGGGAAVGAGRGNAGFGGGGGRGAGAAGGPAGIDVTGLANSPAGQALVQRLGQIQQQIAQTEQEQAVAYAPVYYPGTASPSAAATVTINIGEERSGIDFQLQLVPTSRVAGLITSVSGTIPNGTQVVLVSAESTTNVPGLPANSTRVGPDGRFSFSGITPGLYTLQAQGVVRPDAPADQAQAAGAGGRGGRGGGPLTPGSQVLWASQSLSISGQDLQDLVLTLQPGMTVAGRIEFQGGTPPADLTRVRVNLLPRGSQGVQMGQMPPAEVDSMGRFTIAGVAPGRYVFSAGIAAGGANAQGGGRGGGGAAASAASSWTLTSAVVGGRDVLDFPLDIQPNDSVSGASLTFTDKTQEISGSIQNSAGQGVPDFTIIVYPADNRYWLPQSRRIASARPDTEGKFAFRGLAPGEYRLAAVTDAEPGEWYDPAFLAQLVPVSVPITLNAGEKKVQALAVGAQ